MDPTKIEPKQPSTVDVSQPVINPVSNPVKEADPTVVEVPQAPIKEFVQSSYPELHPSAEVAQFVNPTIVVKPEALHPTPQVTLPNTTQVKAQFQEARLVAAKSTDTSSGKSWRDNLRAFDLGKMFRRMTTSRQGV